MKLEYRKLSETEIVDELGTTPQWSIENGNLTRTICFDEYLQGVAFATWVGAIADRLNHHPDLLIGYRKVTVTVNTHDVKGLSPYDFELARRIDQPTE